ncbi:MAG: response regulator transcription factor [Planctomycetota bacterium]
MNQQKQRIFFVDDEPKICEVVGETLEESGYEVSCFTCAADCLEQLRSPACDLLITDVKMPDTDGIELLTEAKHLAPWLPILVITGYGNIPMAVTAIRAGAVDFIEKPLDKKSFLGKVKSILQRSTVDDSHMGKPLTEKEIRVLKLVIDGKSNRQIGYLLHRSVRTIEVHRANIMRKLDVTNLVDLVKRAATMGLVELPD